MRMTFYTANCRGNAKNSLYPNKRIIDNETDCMEMAAFDHVCGEFKNFHRGVDNFLSSDVEVMDCDNGHSDKPEDWIHPEDLAEELEDVSYVIIPSRNNMKPKDGKTARPRFHVYFPHEPITDAETCATLKKAIRERFAFFDGKALDAARFIFGHPAEKIIWHEGEVTIDCILKPQKREIPQGQRNILPGAWSNAMVRLTRRTKYLWRRRQSAALPWMMGNSPRSGRAPAGLPRRCRHRRAMYPRMPITMSFAGNL